MKTPGVTVRPILTIDGHHHTNEVFLENVRVPIANRIGEENKGWDYAKFLLGNERTGIARVGLSKARLRRARELAENATGPEGPLSRHRAFRRRCLQLEIELTALGVTTLGIIDRQRRRNDGAPDPASANAGAAAHVCDVRDASSVEATFDAIWKDRPLDGLIKDAAGNFIARTETLSPRAVDSILNVVLHGAFYCSIAAGRRWIAERGRGTLLSVVSAAANSGRAFTAPSAAAKAGVVALMNSLAVEWGRHGIRALSVTPGLFPTKGAWDRLYPPGALKRPEAADVPLRRTGEHVEIANLVAYLMSDHAGYITGDNFTINGGRNLLNGGGAGVTGLFDWTAEQWDAFKR